MTILSTITAQTVQNLRSLATQVEGLEYHPSLAQMAPVIAALGPIVAGVDAALKSGELEDDGQFLFSIFSDVTDLVASKDFPGGNSSNKTLTIWLTAQADALEKVGEFALGAPSIDDC